MKNKNYEVCFPNGTVSEGGEYIVTSVTRYSSDHPTQENWSNALKCAAQVARYEEQGRGDVLEKIAMYMKEAFSRCAGRERPGQYNPIEAYRDGLNNMQSLHYDE